MWGENSVGNTETFSSPVLQCNRQGSLLWIFALNFETEGRFGNELSENAF